MIASSYGNKPENDTLNFDPTYEPEIPCPDPTHLRDRYNVCYNPNSEDDSFE